MASIFGMETQEKKVFFQVIKTSSKSNRHISPWQRRLGEKKEQNGFGEQKFKFNGEMCWTHSFSTTHHMKIQTQN